MSPQRIQLRRTKGWRLPPGTKSVARPTRYGNPFRVVRLWHEWQAWDDLPAGPLRATEDEATADAVEAFRLACGPDGPQEISSADLDALVGFDLACWCPLQGQPCHADILLRWVG